MPAFRFRPLVPASLLLAGLELSVSGCARPAADAPASTGAGQLNPSPVTALAESAAPAAAPTAVGQSGEPVTYVGAHLALGLDLHRQLSASEPSKNLLLSPTSVGLALSMTWAGARGDTASEMEQTLHLGKIREQVPRAASALLETLNARVPGGPTLRVVNQLFAEKNPEVPFLPDYLTLSRDQFRAPVELVDFRNHPEASRLAINQWVTRRTEDRIVDLLPPLSITSITRLVLANAVYFLGQWQHEFPSKNTLARPFHAGPGVTKVVPLMSQRGRFAHAELDGLTVVELPYAGTDLSMLVFLPTAKDGLAELESKVTAARLDAWIAELRPGFVDLSLPKFEVRYETKLQLPLENLGMRLAFRESADFSGMNGTKSLYIDEAYHQTFIKVDEAGTEAAAATAVVMNTKSAPPRAVPIVVDHSFLFAIRDRRTEAVLFLGRLVDPSRAS